MNARPYAKQYPASPGQIKVIKMAQRFFDLSDDVYRDILEVRYGVRSSKDLTFDQAKDLIQDNEAKGFVITPSAKPAKKRHYTGHVAHTRKPAERTTIRGSAHGVIISLATPEEIDKINEVAALISWRLKNGLALFLEKRMGIKDGRVKTSAEAQLAIEGLKKMFENGMKKNNGPDWWVMPWVTPAIMQYIKIHLPERYRK